MEWYPCSFGGGTENKTVTFNQAEKRENIKSGEKHKTIFGKIARWFADLKTVAFTGSYNDLIGKPSSFPPSSHGHTGYVDKNGDTCAGRMFLSQGNYVADIACADQADNGVGTHWVKFARFTVTSAYVGHEPVVMEYKVGFRAQPLKLGFSFEHVGDTNPGKVQLIGFLDYGAFNSVAYNNPMHFPAMNSISQNQHCHSGDVHLFLHHAGTSVYDLYMLKEIQWLNLMVSYLSMPHGVKVEWYNRAGEVSAIPQSGVMFQVKCENAGSPLFGLESRVEALEAKVK